MSIFSKIFEGVVGPVIGGIFGKKEVDDNNDFIAEQNRLNRKAAKRPTIVKNIPIYRLNKLRKQAEKHGFNPLTLLGAGGGIGQSGTTLGNGAFNALPPMSSAGIIGEALEGIAGGLSNAFAPVDPIAAERDQLELDLMREELSLMRQPPLGSRANGGQTSQDISLDVLPVDDDGLSFGGHRVTEHPTTSPADAWDQRWGDFGGSLVGLGIMGMDLVHTGRPYLPAIGNHIQSGLSEVTDRVRELDAPYMPPALMVNPDGYPVMNPFTGEPVYQ